MKDCLHVMEKKQKSEHCVTLLYIYLLHHSPCSKIGQGPVYQIQAWRYSGSQLHYCRRPHKRKEDEDEADPSWFMP